MSKTERKKLCAAVDEFAEAMKNRLLFYEGLGWIGWDNIGLLRGRGEKMLLNASRAREFHDKQSLVDTANFAMMIWRKP